MEAEVRARVEAERATVWCGGGEGEGGEGGGEGGEGGDDGGVIPTNSRMAWSLDSILASISARSSARIFSISAEQPQVADSVSVRRRGEVMASYSTGAAATLSREERASHWSSRCDSFMCEDERALILFWLLRENVVAVRYV